VRKRIIFRKRSLKNKLQFLVRILDRPVGGAEIKEFGVLGAIIALVWLEPMSWNDGGETAEKEARFWESASCIGDI